MAIAQIIEIRGGNKEQYERVVNELGLKGSQLAPGQLVHFAGPTEGGWQIVNVWESQEASDKFQEKLIPARRKAGMPDVMPPQKVFPVHRLAK